MRIGVEDISGVVGILPTPATADASRWDAEFTVNLPESAKMTEAVVAAGIHVVMTTGTFGECATLTWEEHQAFIECVVRTTNQRRPVFAGVTTLNTRDTIRRGKALMALGADGLFVGRPMWLAMDDQAIVRFYQDVAEALPQVPLVIYDNPSAFKGKISAQAYAQLAKIPQIVASKHVGGPALEQDLQIIGGKMRLLPLETDWLRLAKVYPDLATACWSGSVACAPAPLVRLAQAIRARDWELAETITGRVTWASSAMFPDGSLAKFMDYSIQIGHARFAGAGLIDPGPSRPPYISAPEAYMEGGLECGRRWASLQLEFSA